MRKLLKQVAAGLYLALLFPLFPAVWILGAPYAILTGDWYAHLEDFGSVFSRKSITDAVRSIKNYR